MDLPTTMSTISSAGQNSEKVFRGHDAEEGLLMEGYTEEDSTRTGPNEEEVLPKRWLGKILHTLRIFVMLFAVWGAVDLGMKLTTSKGRPIPDQWNAASENDLTCFCGNSTTEAKRLGCQYDSLAQAWLPSHCRDDELTAEFEKSGPNEGGGWSFYADPNHTILLSREEVSLLANTGELWYTEWDWHAAHCMFYWKKQWRSWHGNGRELFEANTGVYDHIAHCENAIRWSFKGTRGWVNLGDEASPLRKTPREKKPEDSTLMSR